LVAPQVQLSLDDAARNALYLMEPETRRAQVQTSLICAAPVQVQGDPVALEQIIHNLLSNAVQALERGPTPGRRLSVTVQADANQASLTVQDNGPGIAPDVLAHVFEPFFSTRDGGMGLGLSLCETLAQGMGGQLQAAHAKPQGAVFTLTLPVAKRRNSDESGPNP
jgi:C4-dicarboxylate-specific signal transduction histidine kinase